MTQQGRSGCPNDAARPSSSTCWKIPAKRMTYLYDFGDGWEHTIPVEYVVAPEPGVRYPQFVEAIGRRPPRGHRRAARIRGIPGSDQGSQPRASRHAEFTEYYDANFDPAAVDTEVMRRELATLTKRWSRPSRKRKAG